MNNDFKLTLYRDLFRIRQVEETIAEHYPAQEMRCPVHLSIGQEAIAVGVCRALERSDYVISTHRSHAHYLAKGGNLKRMVSEIYGKEAGCCAGRGGSMHLFDDDVHMLASIPIVASSIPLGVGAALASKQRGENTVSVIFLGDASMEEGVFHESANFAALKKLPAIFVCENNLYSVYTDLAARQPDRPLSKIATAHGLPCSVGNGNDVEGVYALTETAVAAARAGEGPQFLLFDTYRWREHCGPNFDNDIGYRTIAEFESWKSRCPLENYRQFLRAADILDAATEQKIHDDVMSEIDTTFEFAKAAPEPGQATASERVYA